ncbi:hypothetical protein FQN50_004872 [Emmonsiellopsis sp. PD_5]|nr:hypothetical protein FQN50_004872 [Emmonsiellopsis sp. PD_5]
MSNLANEYELGSNYLSSSSRSPSSLILTSFHDVQFTHVAKRDSYRDITNCFNSTLVGSQPMSQLKRRDASSPSPSRSPVSNRVHGNGDSTWTRVDVNLSENITDDDDDSNNTVIVSRDPSKTNLLLKAWQTGDVSEQGNNALAISVGARNLELRANPEALGRAAAEVGKLMPESFSGEHSHRMNALVAGNPAEAKLEAFRLLAYQLSNNLIEAAEWDSDDSYDEDDEKYPRIIAMFREINLPRNMWAKIFSTEQDRTSSAFAEALFEAALDTVAWDIAQALLEAGVDPNQPIVTHWNCCVERPIQLATDLRIRGFEMAKLLVQAGAEVDGVTEDNEKSALHVTAGSGTLEMTKLLVENGADIRRWVEAEYTNSPVEWYTPLIAAADSSRLGWRFTFNNRESDGEGEGTEKKEPECLRVFRYLLSLHDDVRDHEILRESLTVAAHRGRSDMIELLLDRGVDINEENSRGLTALETAVWQNYKIRDTVSKLISHGATVNRPDGLSALHMAAANKDWELVQLLVDNGADIDAKVNLQPSRHSDMLGDQFSRRKTSSMAHLHTPLQLALHRVNESPSVVSITPKTDKGAMILLQAGAKLTGGEIIQAVDFDSEILLQALLDRGADVNEESWNDSTALQACLKAGHQKLAGILLRAGAKLKGGELFSAFKKGKREIIDTLLARGARIEDTGPNGESILEAACLGQNWEGMTWAMEHDTSPYDAGALCAAVSSPSGVNITVHIKKILSQRTPENANPLLEATAVGYAAYMQDWDKLHCLLPLQIQSDCIVATSGYYGYSSLVLHRTYSLTNDYKAQFWHDHSLIRCSALVPAILSGSWEIVQAMLKAGYRPDALSLLVAIKRSSPADIAELIKHGADVNSRARRDLDTPLQLAVRFKRADLVQTLLSNGADVNAPPPVGVPLHNKLEDEPNELAPRTALQAAVERGHLEIIDILLAAGANVNGPLSLDLGRTVGATELQFAAAKGHLGIAKRLMELGAKIDAPRADTKGRTALEGAAEQGRLDMVQFLLENGANTLDGRGVWQYHRAIGFAQRYGHRTVARLLEDWRVWALRDYKCSRSDGLLDDDFRLVWRRTSGYGDDEDDGYSADEDSVDEEEQGEEAEEDYDDLTDD